LTKPSSIRERELKTAAVQKKRPIRPTVGKNLIGRTIAVPAGAKKLMFGFDGLPVSNSSENTNSSGNTKSSGKPRPSTATPKPITIRHPGNLPPAADNDSVIDATLSNTPAMSIPMPGAVIGGFKVHPSSSNLRSIESGNEHTTANPRPVRLFDPNSKNRTQNDLIELVDFDDNSNAGVIVQPAARR
jgi:hypothetical protein